MRTGTGNRPNYSRTTGSRTARLYSKRTARNINRVYQQQNSREAARRRSAQNSHHYEYEYDDYYDRPRSSSNKKKSKNKGSTAVIIATLIVIVLAVVFVALALMKPVTPTTQLADTTETSADESAAAQTVTEPVQTVAESDPPTIYGIIPIIVYEGHSVAYKQGIYVEDDTDENPTLEVDNEFVDLSTPGTYIVSYIARDKDGNVTRESTSVTVLEGTNMISDEEIYAMADSILATIVTDYMTDSEKCLRVYEYLHAIGYVDEVHSEDWMQNAYWMLQLRRGDCFCYYSAARLLLTRLGYDVMEVQNNNNYTHYWCLVSTDGGDTWWHFDATQWVWGEDGILCLVSDNYLSEFTRRHKTSDGRLIHAWDKSNYPATPLNDFWTDEDRSIIYEGAYLNYEAFNGQLDPYGTGTGAGTGYGYDTTLDPYGTGTGYGYGTTTDPYGTGTGYGYDTTTDPYGTGTGTGIGYGYDTTTDPYGTGTGYGYDTTTDPYGTGTGYGYDTTTDPYGTGMGYGYDTTTDPYGTGTGYGYDTMTDPYGTGAGYGYDTTTDPYGTGAGYGYGYDTTTDPYGTGTGYGYDTTQIGYGTMNGLDQSW